jgi:hypothetical protein
VACWNAFRLLPHFSGLRLIVVRRDPFYVVQSTYLARKRRYGDVRRWWSLKPPSFDRIRREPDPIRQIVAQVRDCQAVLDRLTASHSSRCIVVDYQDIRRHAERVIGELSEFCGFRLNEGLDLPKEDDLPDGDHRQVSAQEAAEIQAALVESEDAPSAGLDA